MPTIEVVVLPQYTVGSPTALIQYAWRTAAVGGTPAGDWHRENYSPTQAQLSARAPAAVLALSPGYWGDAEAKADTAAHLTALYGFTDLSFLAGGT